MEKVQALRNLVFACLLASTSFPPKLITLFQFLDYITLSPTIELHTTGSNISVSQDFLILALKVPYFRNLSILSTPRQLVTLLYEVKVTHSCPTLCDPRDYTVHGILQARILEWVAFPFSRASSQPRNRTGVSCIAGRFFTN